MRAQIKDCLFFFRFFLSSQFCFCAIACLDSVFCADESIFILSLRYLKKRKKSLTSTLKEVKYTYTKKMIVSLHEEAFQPDLFTTKAYQLSLGLLGVSIHSSFKAVSFHFLVQANNI